LGLCTSILSLLSYAEERGTEGDGAIAVGNNIRAARKRKGYVTQYKN